MPGRTQSSAADGDWSDASEDAVKSGSATDASKTEGDDPGGQNFGGLGVKSSLMFLSSRGVGVKDPVHSVLDKIDAELAAMSSSHSKGGRGSARQSTTCKPKSSLPPLLTSYNTLYTTDSADKSGRTNALGVKGGAALEKDQHHITGSAEIYTDATLTDDEARATHSAEDFLGDLDSVVAQQIDSRFKEIMLKKKGTTTPPPSSHPASVLTLSPPTPFSAYLDNNSSPLNFPSETSPPPKPLTTAGYGTDNDSIKTEDFESRFENLIITDGNTSGESAKTSRHKRAKNSNGNGGLRKAGLGSGFGSGASMSVSAARPSTKPAAMNVAGWTSARGGSGGVGKVTFDVSSTEKDGKAASPSSLRMNGLNRVLQHSMKSLGETNAKEPAESASTALASLPPSGRSRSVSPERLILYNPRFHPRFPTEYGSPQGGLTSHNPHPHPSPNHPVYLPHPGWVQEGGGGGGWGYPHHHPYPDIHGLNLSSRSSKRSTFEEVESLCLSRSSNDSFHFPPHSLNHHAGRQGLRGSPHPPPTSTRGGRFLSRQSSTTSTSTSSGNLAEHLDKRSSTLGSGYEEAMETLDPRQQFDLNDHSLMDGIFRRVLEWNNAHAAQGMGRGGGGGGGGGGWGGCPPGVPFPQVPPGSYPQRFYPPGYGPPPPSHSPNHPRPQPQPPQQGVNSVNPFTRPVPVAGQRVADVNKDKTLSPTSDITHVKRRRDLILPDEDDDLSFNRPGSRNPDSSPRAVCHAQSASSGGTSSLSSKMTSSDSWVSSSSLSQSQDLNNWREQFGPGDSRRDPWRDQYNSGWGDTYARQWTGVDSMWRDPPPPPPFSGPPPGMMLPPGYNMPPGMSRGLSVDSMNSYGIPSPPAAFAPPSQYVAPPQRQNTAEMMLMNLGFGGSSEGFLPERFLKDWYNKLSVAQPQAAANQSVAAGSAANSPHRSESNLYQPRDPKVPLSSKPSYEDLRSASDLHRRLTNHLNRAATISTSPSHESSEMSSARLPTSLGSQSRNDRLKEYIEAHAHNTGNPPDARSQRIRQFASSRQKSLPSYLETLTEEVEAKERTSAYKRQEGQSHLLTFLREDSFSAKSESQNNSSGCTSNSTSHFGSESESQSGSDYHDYIQKKRQGLFASREQSLHVTMSQPAPVTHRLLTMRNQASLDVQQEQLNQKLKTPDNIVAPPTPKKRHKQGHRSRHNSPKHQAQPSHHDPSGNQGVHLDVQTGNGLDSPSPKCKSPKKERRSKSPDPRNKSPSHRPRSPRHSRGRSPSKEVKHENILKAKAPKSSFDDSSSSSSSRRRKAFSVERKLSPMNSTAESPIKKQEASVLSTGDNHSDEPADEPDEKHQQQTECLPKLPQNPVICRSKNESEKQGNTTDPRSERTEPLISIESLEVADIFQTRNTSKSMPNHRNDNSCVETISYAARSKGELEPAMISIVLEDVDGNLTDSGSNLHASNNHPETPVGQSEEPHPPEDLLHLPSFSSSLSVSPIPMSPVTVIEVSLDNQQDSMDTEEGTSSSKDFTEDGGETSGMDSDTMQTLTDLLSEDTDPGEFPDIMNFGPDKFLSGPVRLLQCPIVDSPSLKRMCDVGVEADDGSTSPLLMLNDVSPLMSSSSSSSPSVVSQTCNLSEVGVQSDDGRLTPLVLFRRDEAMSAVIENSVTEDLYEVADQGVQCDGEVMLADTHTACETDYTAEGPLLEMAHKITQTNRMVRYEMSSQTDTNTSKPSTTTSAKSIRPPRWGNDLMLNSRSDSDFDSKYRTHITKKTHYVAPDESHSSLHNLPVSHHHASKDLHQLSRSFSFEAEFWDYLGMDMPWQLHNTETLLNMKQNASRGSDVLKADGAVYYQRDTSLPTKNPPPNKASAYAVLQHRVNTCHYPSQHQKNVSSHTSPAFPVDFNGHGITGNRFSDRCSDSRMTRALSERYSHSDASQWPTFASPGKSRDSGTVCPAVSVKNQSVNTCVSVPADESESTGGSRIPEKSHCSFVKPFPLNHPTLKQNEIQDELHVSILSFNVNDYRYLNGISASPDNSAHLKTDSSKHSCASSDTHEGLTLKTNPDMSQSSLAYREALGIEPPYIPAKNPNDTGQQSSTSHVVDRKQTSAAASTEKQGSSGGCHDIFHSADSSTIMPSLAASRRLLPDNTVQQKPTLTIPGTDAKSDFSLQRETDQKELTSREEARKLVMKQFLLSGSADSDCKLAGASVHTVKDVDKPMQDFSLSFEHKRGHSENRQVVECVSDDAKAKVLAMFMLRESSVSSEMPCESSQHFAHKPNESDREKDDIQENDEMKDKAVNKARITAADTENNDAEDSFPHQEEAADTPNVNPRTDDESKMDSTDFLENELCVKYRTNSALKNTDCLSGKGNINAPTNSNNQTLDDHHSWLLETFAYSVIESACHELQKTYVKNKQKLKERLQGELKLTGVFAPDEKDEDSNTSEEKEAVRTDTGTALNKGCCQKRTKLSESGTASSGVFTDDEGGIYPEKTNNYTPSWDCECHSLQPGTDAVCDIKYDPFCEIPDERCPQLDEKSSDSYHQNSEDSQLPIQIFVQSADDPGISREILKSADVSSHAEFQAPSDNTRLCALRCLSSDSFNSLCVNFSESTEDVTDDTDAEDVKQNHSQSLQSDSDDEMREVSVFEPEEPEEPMPPKGEEFQQNVMVIDVTQSLSCSCSCEDKAAETDPADVVMDQQKMHLSPQFCSRADSQHFLDQENWFNSTIDMEGSEGVLDGSSEMYEIHENQFESLLFLDSDRLQDAYDGYGLVGYLPRISEEPEHFDQISEQPNAMEVSNGGLSGIFSTSQGNSSSDTHSSEKSSVELSSGEAEFGIEVSLQPLPTLFDEDEVKITSLCGESILTPTDTKTEQVKENGEKETKQQTRLLQSPSVASCDSPEDAPSLPVWWVENRELQSPDLFTNSHTSPTQSDCREEKSCAILVKDVTESANFLDDDFINPETKNDHEIVCILQSDTTVDHSTATSVSCSLASVSDQPAGNDSPTENVFHNSSAANQPDIEISVVPISNDLKDQSLDTETKPLPENEESQTNDSQDMIDPNSPFSEKSASSSSPKLIHRFQRSISKESDTSNQSPPKTIKSTAADFSTSPATRETNLLCVHQTIESLVSKNALLRLGSSSSESDQSSQPRSQSPVPEASSPSGFQSPVFGQSSSLEGPYLQSPTPVAPRSLSPIPSVVLFSKTKSVQLLSGASSRESSGWTSPLSDGMLSGNRSPTPEHQVYENHSTEDDCVFVQEQLTVPTTASFVTQSADELDASSRNTFSQASEIDASSRNTFSQASEIGTLANCSNAEDPVNKSPVHQQVVLTVSEKENSSVPSKESEPSHLPQQLSQSPISVQTSTSKLGSSPKSPGKVLEPSRTMSSSGEESALFQFTLSRTYYSSGSVVPPQVQPESEVQGKSSSSESPIPSTPPLSRDHSSTSDSSSSVRDTQPGSVQGFQPPTAASAKTSFVHDSLGSRFVITGTPSMGSSSNGHDVNSVPFHDETKLAKDTKLPETDCIEMNQDLSSTIPQPTSSNPPASYTSSTTSTVSPKARSLVSVHLRRSRFQNMSNTMSAFEMDSSSEHSSADNGATPKRRFFWSTDQKTVVSPVHNRVESNLGGRWLASENSHSYSSRNSDSGSLSDDSSKNDLGNCGERSSRRPRSIRKLQNDAGNSTIESFVFSNSSRKFGGSSSDLERRSCLRQPRVSPVEQECKSDSEIHLSPTTGQVSMNGMKRESPRRSVRELARQFERKENV